MPTWLKVILIIVAVFVVLVVAAGFIGYRWIKAHTGELEAHAAEVRADATQFAQGKDVNACIDESLARIDRCGGIMCQVKAKLFLSICTEKTGVPRDFCATVPKRDQFIASAQWALVECGRRGHPNDQSCTQLITALQDRCEGR